MKNVIDFLFQIIPVVITGIFTIVIAMYTKNRPLDKLETAYNRVYYPIYRIIKDKEQLDDESIKKCQFYMSKYDKYVDRITVYTFSNYMTKSEDKKAFDNYKDNILSNNIKLRRKLGYLESNIIGIYKYATKHEKRVLRMVIEAVFTYLFAFMYELVDKQEMKNMLGTIGGCFLLVLMIETAIFGFELLISKCKRNN